MNGKHTPGPWLRQGRVRYPGRRSDYLITSTNSNGVIAEVSRIEDARLVAAAPELLEACEMMYEAWKQLLPCLGKGVVQDYELVLTKAPVACSAAIAKAKGE